VEELRKKRVTWSLYRYHSLLSERGAISGRLEAAVAEEARVNGSLRALMESISTEESEVEGLSRRHQEANEALLRLDGEIRSLGERGEHGRRLSAELADRVKGYGQEILVTEGRVADHTSEREDLADESTALQAEAALREAELARADELIAGVRGEVRGIETELASLNGERVNVLESRTRLRNERVDLEALRRSGETVGRRLTDRLEAVGGERGRLAAGREAAVPGIEEKRAREAEVRGRLSRSVEEYGELEERVADLASQAGESDRKLSGSRSRLDLLLSLKARHEGMDQSVQKILAEAEREGSVLSGIRGVVADVVHVEGPDAESVELALGACAQGIVTDSMEDALSAIGWLKSEKLGRALFVPLSEVREAGPSYGGNGVARQALRAVRADSEYLPLVRALLSDSILVDDLEAARKVAGAGNTSLRIVTGGGEVLNRIGTITGGRGRSARALLTRNAEIEQLEVEVSVEEERGAALEEALGSLRTTHGELKGEIRVLREELEIAAREARRAEEETSRLDADLRRLDEEERALEAELAELGVEREGAARREAELEKAEGVVAREEERFTEAARALEARHEDARERSAAAADQRTEVRVVLAGAHERQRAAERRMNAIDVGLEESRKALIRAREEMESCERRRDESVLDAEMSEQRAKEARDGRAQRVSQAAKFREEYEAARNLLLSRRGDAEGLREEHERYRGALEEFRLKEGEVRTRMEELLTRVSDEFDLDLEDLYQGFQPEEVDWDELDREVSGLREKVEKMGNVNLEAIDQLAEVEERVRFLRSEEADLLKSRETLMDVLRKVNRESRERFEKSFEVIRDNFREMFRKLFGGGNAEIRLEEGEDILEAGIEIVVRPPGRELQRLNLLSGGEKTLTAVALLFAIFKARPSPFALMDEVDAALDESNIDRFLSLLREFSDDSQFVIITHNKRTMAEADALYGVSMPEAGISQPVSIRFAGSNGNRNGNGKAVEKAEPAEAAAGD